MVCSGTVVKDVNHPGRSNLVWTAGHCVHAGKDGGWYRNIEFVPSYNDLGESASQLSNASASEIAPYGQWWADWASTSNQWIQGGSETGGAGAAYDYAILRVKPQSGANPSMRRSVPRSTSTSRRPPRPRPARWAPGATRPRRRKAA